RTSLVASLQGRARRPTPRVRGELSEDVARTRGGERRASGAGDQDRSLAPERALAAPRAALEDGRMRCLALALAIVIALLHVRPARADNTAAASETARALFNEGLALHERGDLDAAIVKLRAAYALRATPVTAFELARAYVDHGDLVEARDLLLSINRMPESASRDSRASRAAVHDAAT